MKAPLFLLIQASYVFVCLFGIASMVRARGHAPGLAIAGSLAIFGAFCLLGFGGAWLLLPNVNAGTSLRRVLMIASFAPVPWALLRGYWRDEIAMPLLIALAATAGLLLWGHFGTGFSNPLRVAAARWTHGLPGDNQIPLDLSRGILTGAVPHPLHADWLSSDRPPLQTGFVLLTPAFAFGRGSDVSYQVASVAFQMTALLGGWALARALGAGSGLAIATMVALFFTPLTLVNGLFVWPKLIAAAFLLGLAAIHLTDNFYEVRRSLVWGGIVGMLAALAMLSHGASAFAVIGIGLTCVLLGRLGSIRYVAGAAVIATSLFAPWLAYQKLVDPPGDRLIKWQLAGVIDVDSRSTVQAIRDSYRILSWEDWTRGREANLRELVGGVERTYGGSWRALIDLGKGRLQAMSERLKAVRIAQFFGVIAGSGLIGLSLFTVWLGVLGRNTRPLTLALVLSFSVWVTLMFIPSTTVVHLGSLFPELALIVGTIFIVRRLSRAVAGALVTAHVLLTVFQYAL